MIFSLTFPKMDHEKMEAVDSLNIPTVLWSILFDNFKNNEEKYTLNII